MTIIEEARQILDQLIPQLEAEGYTVDLEPPGQLLPAFMQGYTPDAIALRPKDSEGARKNLAIEVTVEGPSSRLKENGLKRRFGDAKDWELRVYYVRPAGRTSSLSPVTQDAIDASLASLGSLMTAEQYQAALLLGWATFEAVGRALAPEKFGRPQSPGRLIEVLANDGLVTPTEADVLRVLSNTRNQLIHGGLDHAVQRADLSKFIEILKTLRQMMNS